MPIYAYRCEACGFAKDVLQKISDPQLTDCPSCAKPTFKKQVTAAGFQLKGTGWYVTDFRGGSTPAATPPASPNNNNDAGNGNSGNNGSNAAGNTNDGAATAPKSDSTPSSNSTPSTKSD